MTKDAIKLVGLTKIYSAKNGKEKLALDNVDLEVPKGSFFGLLGPNGAGKSTMINILAGTVVKTSGQAHIAGHNIDTNERAAKRSIGVVPQELILDPFFPPKETLEYMAGFYGIPKNKRRTMEILHAVGLEEKANMPARSLSGGMRRRLLVAKAMVHDPEVLILDEPTAGVDVELRTRLWEYVRELNKKGTTILLTTHYLEEAQELCDEIAVINHGKIIARDKKNKIMKILDKKVLLISTMKPLKNIPKEMADFDSGIDDDGRLEITYKPSVTKVDDILKAFGKTNLEISDIATEEADLEDVFRHLTKASD